jgi:hypothetical protein
MHAIIETKHQLNQLKCCTNDSCFIQIIPGNDNFHPKLTNVSSIYYRCKNSKGYILPINHSETFNLQWDDVLEFIKNHKIIHVLDKKFHLYFLPATLPITDIQFKILNKENKTFKVNEYNTPIHTHFYREHYFRENINNIIPIVKHLEKWEVIFDHIKLFLDGKQEEWFDNQYTAVFKQIEQQGIKISPSKFHFFFEPNFDEYSIYKNKIHSSYNLYNLTTRPTNSHNNINFAALPRENGARKVFIPQHDYFIEYDFTAYHPSIISNLLGHKFNSSPYLHLGEILNVSEKQAKEITFQNLYGGVRKEFKDKPFFKQVYEKTYDLWNEFQRNGLITLPNGRIVYDNGDFSPSKLFNYLIQSLETISNVEILQKILPYLQDKQSNIVLYTYDSILIDFSKEDGVQLVKDIQSLLEYTGFKTKLKKGTNYDFE